MSFSYNNTITETRDQVRLLIGDTDENEAQLQDEELDWIITQETGLHEAAVMAADSIAASYARRIDTAVGDVRISMMQLQTSYQMLADRLRRKLDRRGISPYLGGLSQSDKQSNREDTTVTQPYFRRGMETEPATEEDTITNLTPGSGPFPY